MEYLLILKLIFTSVRLLKAILKQLLKAITIVKISKFLLHKNEFINGIGRAMHFADRFIDIWKSPTGINSNNESYPTAFNHPRLILSVIDKNLEDKGLVFIKDGKVYPNKSNRNKVIIKILKLYQIKVRGHNQNDYIGI